jgi:hypothetical protein
MEGVAATVCIEGLNFECGKMSDRAACASGVITTVRSSRNDRSGSASLREVRTRICRINGITCPPRKVEWDYQVVDEVSQEESGLGMAFYVSQDRDTENAYLFCDFG